MDDSMHAWMDGLKMDEWMDGWMDGWMDLWMDGWMDRWMDGWMDALTGKKRSNVNPTLSLKWQPELKGIPQPQ
jgi:hypothetical protein